MDKLEITKEVNLKYEINSKIKKILNKNDVNWIKDYYNIITKNEIEDNFEEIILGK